MVAVGQTYALPVRLHVMRARCCHENVDELFRDKGYDFGTGWAYTEDDGLWRQHSWAFDGDTIVETTTPRDIYWGGPPTSGDATGGGGEVTTRPRTPSRADSYPDSEVDRNREDGANSVAIVSTVDCRWRSMLNGA